MGDLGRRDSISEKRGEEGLEVRKAGRVKARETKRDESENEPFVEGRTCFPSTVTNAGYESLLNLCTRTFGVGVVGSSIDSELSTMASSFATTVGGFERGGK